MTLQVRGEGGVSSSPIITSALHSSLYGAGNASPPLVRGFALLISSATAPWAAGCFSRSRTFVLRRSVAVKWLRWVSLTMLYDESFKLFTSFFNLKVKVIHVAQMLLLARGLYVHFGLPPLDSSSQNPWVSCPLLFSFRCCHSHDSLGQNDAPKQFPALYSLAGEAPLANKPRPLLSGASLQVVDFVTGQRQTKRVYFLDIYRTLQKLN